MNDLTGTRTSPEFEPIKVDEFWGHQYHVTALLVLNSGSHVVTGCADGVIRIFEKNAPHALIGQMKSHDKQINCLAISENDVTLVSAGNDRVINVFNMNDLSLVKAFKGHRKNITDVKISRDAKIVCSVGWDRRVNFWDIKNYKKIALLTLDGKPLSCCGFSFKNYMLAVGSWSGTVKLFPLSKLPKLEDEDSVTLSDHSTKVTSIAFSRAGMMATGSYDGFVYIYHYRGFYNLFKFNPDGGWIRSMAFSPDSLLLATITDADFMVKVWDAVSQELECSFQISTEDLLLCQFLHDGRLIAAGSSLSAEISY